MKKVSGNRRVSRIIGAISLICLISIGISFGYYLLSKKQDNNNVAGSKCFKLEFSNESEAINLSNMYPISDEEGRKLTPYSFTITNTCDMLAGYTVNIEMLEGTTLNSKYLDLMVNNEEIKLLSNYEETKTVIDGSTESRVIAKGTLGYNDSVDYTVRFWMDKDVEDVDSMNKYFASKIVVVATPSTWDSTSAGYSTLHDAILANEYQSTPEDAIKRIEAKGSPDLSNTAPIIKWVEKTGESSTRRVIKPTLEAINSVPELSDLSQDEQYMYVCTGKTFNSETAWYTLSDCSLKDPATLDYSGDTKYYYSTEYMSYNHQNQKIYSARNHGNVEVFQIVGATKSISTQTTNGVQYAVNVYSLSCVTLTETELENDKSDRGLYQNVDDYGTTYYYRGNVKNNNVYFAGYYWQIVRINGDGSIRLIYNGSVKNATGNAQSINNRIYQFNSKYNDPAYVGYMYGDPDATTFAEVHANTNDSTIKAAVDSWYKTNIEDKGYSGYISTSIGFCGDRSLYSNSGGDGVQTDKDTRFGAYGRYQANTAQFTCSEPARNLYTTTGSSVGNKALTYPVGLITYDEMVFAGIDGRHINKLSWIYSMFHTWTMSPSGFVAGNAAGGEFNEVSVGTLYANTITSERNARPVINLKPDVKITGGTGTSNEPFIVETN